MPEVRLQNRARGSQLAGDGPLPNYVAYYAVARPGSRVARAPEGFDITGLLTVAGQYRGSADIEALKGIAREVEADLDVLVSADGALLTEEMPRMHTTAQVRRRGKALEGGGR